MWVDSCILSVASYHTCGLNYACMRMSQVSILIQKFSFFFSCKPNFFCRYTIEYCPKYFLQVFTIHSIQNGHYILLVVMLLPNKHHDTYNIAFRLLSEHCDNTHLHLQLKRIVSDYEKAIHCSIKNHWYY